MKRKTPSLLGNASGLGLVVMVVGGEFNPQPATTVNMPSISYGALISIFIGAILWLAGARAGGMNRCATVTSGSHYDKRCRRSDNRHHS